MPVPTTCKMSSYRIVEAKKSGSSPRGRRKGLLGCNTKYVFKHSILTFYLKRISKQALMTLSNVKVLLVIFVTLRHVGYIGITSSMCYLALVPMSVAVPITPLRTIVVYASVQLFYPSWLTHFIKGYWDWPIPAKVAFKQKKGNDVVQFVVLHMLQLATCLAGLIFERTWPSLPKTAPLATIVSTCVVQASHRTVEGVRMERTPILAVTIVLFATHVVLARVYVRRASSEVRAVFWASLRLLTFLLKFFFFSSNR